MVALMETGRKTGNYLQLFSAISYKKGKFRAIIQIQGLIIYKPAGPYR